MRSTGKETRMSDVQEMLVRLRQIIDTQHSGGVDFKRTFIDVRSMIEWLAKDRDELRAETEKLRTALVAHNDILRSAFQAVNRDAIFETKGTTNYCGLADSINKVLIKFHKITNDARAGHTD
jgi:hypothetical protein